MTKSMAIPAVILAFLLVGCAKQPTTTQGAAPSPDGAVGMKVMPGGMQPASATSGGGRSMSGSGATRPSLEGFRTAADLSDIHFEFDRSDIREVDGKALDTNAGWLKEHPDQLVVIEGHTDERGTNEYNTALGDRRAKATMNYLVSRGVPSSRITVISYGEERPDCAQHADECWAQNRRAHFLVKAR
ncbi:MAG TPA: peptidoglycan-associated lipoprotein Pal [Candidatus Acidoferrum sp.]|jgi:peptidoglycan-associated lipoprotein|nr:peptidoglycan-associated lipoprotein Pal [Candidatus Acidoferrum sp.]